MGGRGASSYKTKVMTEEEYLESKGYEFMGWQDPGMDLLNARNSKRHNNFLKKLRSDKRKEYEAKRTEYREEYNRLVKSGKMRAPTSYEKALKISKGNPDNPSVQAAKRLVKKYEKIMKEKNKK